MRENAVSERLLERRGGRLVYIGSSASPELWDALWQLDAETVRRETEPSKEGQLFVELTGRYLRPGDGAVLEGGCGTGKFVAALSRAGYQAIGIDYAEKTVSALNQHAPELDIRLGDLRAIDLPDASVAGYWSIGVIEHFWNGFEDLATEMSRVLRDGGYLFCSFPYMSPLRRAKASLGLYPTLEDAETGEPADFYQFALRHRDVVQQMSRHGFELVDNREMGGMKGVQGEFGPLSAPLARLYGYEGESFLPRALRRVADVALSATGFAHSKLLILRRVPRSIS